MSILGQEDISAVKVPSLRDNVACFNNQNKGGPSVQLHRSATKNTSEHRIKKPVRPEKKKTEVKGKLIPLYKVAIRENSALKLRPRDGIKLGNQDISSPPKLQRIITNPPKSLRHNQLVYQPQPVLPKDSPSLTTLSHPSTTKRVKKINKKTLFNKAFKTANNYLSCFNK